MRFYNNGDRTVRKLQTTYKEVEIVDIESGEVWVEPLIQFETNWSRITDKLQSTLCEVKYVLRKRGYYNAKLTLDRTTYSV